MGDAPKYSEAGVSRRVRVEGNGSCAAAAGHRQENSRLIGAAVLCARREAAVAAGGRTHEGQGREPERRGSLRGSAAKSG